ncbi:hypothetical protein B0H65DRAFT_463268 [Neurospora tetraspora]|uniref:Secreted protein n=1 Tax=Neurospora tetraspora TaxID=94610 RepID=A0AAE0JIW9_9PEZI|nr:hypothetical protein B0H65DRAFT_463268 [Neurospora tetraspora]
MCPYLFLDGFCLCLPDVCWSLVALVIQCSGTQHFASSLTRWTLTLGYSVKSAGKSMEPTSDNERGNQGGFTWGLLGAKLSLPPLYLLKRGIRNSGTVF